MLDLLRLVFGASAPLPLQNGWTRARLPVWRVMNVTACEASQGGTGGESLSFGLSSAMIDGNKGLNARASRGARTSPNAWTSRRCHNRL
jgi:hypothetical protein